MVFTNSFVENTAGNKLWNHRIPLVNNCIICDTLLQYINFTYQFCYGKTRAILKRAAQDQTALDTVQDPSIKELLFNLLSC